MSGGKKKKRRGEPLFVSFLASVRDRLSLVFPPITSNSKTTSPYKLTSRILNPRAWPRDVKTDGKELERAAEGGAIRFVHVEGGIKLPIAKLAAAAAAAVVVPVDSSLLVASLKQSVETALPRAAIIATSPFSPREKGKEEREE